MKLKYVGNEVVYLRQQNSSIKLVKNQVIDVTKREFERFKDRKDFKQVNKK